MVPDDYSAVDALDTVGFPTLKKNARAQRKRTAAQLKPLLKIVYEAANINAHVGKEGGDSVSADAQSAGHVISAEVKGALESEPAAAIQDNIDALAQIDNWDTISAQIYLDNKQILDDDLSYEVNSWNRGVFFDAGMFAGRYQLIFYEQAPAQIIDEMLSYI